MSRRPDELPISPASERNKQPILEILQQWLPEGAHVLEVGSGTGQHAVHFNRWLPGIRWQASELAPHLEVLEARIAREGTGMPAPIELDVTAGAWPDVRVDAVFTANTLHIMPWGHTAILIEETSARLVEDGLLVIYGPFHDGGRHNAMSNQQFDQSLRERNPDMGIRDALEVTRLARAAGLEMDDEVTMPANNRILIYRK